MKSTPIPSYDLSNHWKIKDYVQRMPATTWKQILLDEADMIIFEGRLYRLVATKLGFGIVSVTKKLEERKR